MNKKIILFMFCIFLISNVSASTFLLPQTREIVDSYTESEAIEAQTQINDTAKFREYLEYQKGKEQINDNINSAWLHVISIFQLLYELLIVALSMFSLFLMIYVFIELLPNALMYIRDIILGFLIKDGRPKKRKKTTKKTKKRKKRSKK